MGTGMRRIRITGLTLAAGVSLCAAGSFTALAKEPPTASNSTCTASATTPALLSGGTVTSAKGAARCRGAVTQSSIKVSLKQLLTGGGSRTVATAQRAASSLAANAVITAEARKRCAATGTYFTRTEFHYATAASPTIQTLVAESPNRRIRGCGS